MNFALRLSPVLLVLALGCRADAPDASSDSVVPAPETTADDTGPEDSEFVWACLPGEQRCGDAETVEHCAPTGLEWLPDPCGPGAACVPCTDPGCSTARCEGPCDVAADLPSSAGCNFVANRNLHLYAHDADGVVIGNPNESGTALVSIYEVPIGKRNEELLTTLEIEPGQVSEPVELSREFLPCCQSFLRTGGIYRIRSNLPVVAYQHSPLRANLGNESSLLLPDEVLGTNYVVAAAPNSYSFVASADRGFVGPGYFIVVALEDDTRVDWTPRVSPTNGNGLPIPPAEVGETKSITLNRYETMRIVASTNSADWDDPDLAWTLNLDVSGTVVRSDRPIWVIGGSNLSIVPFSNSLGTITVDEQTIFRGGTNDPLQEVLFPLATWGRKYVAPAPPRRFEGNEDFGPSTEDSYWRLFAGSPGVTISADPPHPDFPFTLEERGDFRDVIVPHGQSLVFEGDGAFLPVQYLRSRQIGQQAVAEYGVEPTDRVIRRGDPASVQMVPTAQFLQRYTFATAVGFAFNYVQVIRENGGAEVLLDGEVVTGFEPVNAEFEIATVSIDEGAHDIRSDGDFGIIQMGWAFASTSRDEMGNLIPGMDPGCVWDYVREIDGEIFQPRQCNSSYAYPGGLKTERIFTP